MSISARDTGALTSATTVPVTDVASFSKALSTGTGTGSQALDVVLVIG